MTTPWALSYPQRQRYRRLARAIRMALFAACAVWLAAMAGLAGMGSIALALAVLGGGLGVRARRWGGLARRSLIGARSEERVRRRLHALEREGWEIRHSLRWRDGGDIDHLAIAPGPDAFAFAIETKTVAYAPYDLARIGSIAARLGHRRTRRRQRAAMPILCLAGARGVEYSEGGVLVLSVDRLLPALRRSAGLTSRPGFLR
jgi:hypothetical protein